MRYLHIVICQLLIERHETSHIIDNHRAGVLVLLHPPSALPTAFTLAAVLYTGFLSSTTLLTLLSLANRKKNLNE